MSGSRVDTTHDNITYDDTMPQKPGSSGAKKGAVIPHNTGLMGDFWWTLVLLIELFVMFIMSFPRLDDLTWGSSIGIERLSTWFAGYNGRYVGNLIVIVLTRLPAGIRAGLEVAVLCMLLYYVHRLLPKKGAFCFFLLAFLCLPIKVFAESIVWTAGFANYTTSAVVMLFVMYKCYCIVIRKEKLSRVGHIVFPVVCFLGQLILENTTFYVIVLTGCFMIIGLIEERKVYIPVLTGFISAICGGIWMFVNSSYHSALTGDGETYKTISLMPQELLDKYTNDIIPHLVQNNHIINLSLAILLLFLWRTKNTEGENRKLIWCNKIGILCGIALNIYFIYDMVFSWGRRVHAIVSLLYAAYIIVTILMTVDKKESKLLLLLIALSQVVLVVPLVPASPLSDRCFFQNGILWAMLLGSMIQIIMERRNVDFENIDRKWIQIRIVRFTQIVCVCYLAFMLCEQSLSWNIQSIRKEITRSCVENRAEVIILPEVPDADIYCYGANISNTDDYWLTNYKRYYNIPMDMELEFVNYYVWIERYGDD